MFKSKKVTPQSPPRTSANAPTCQQTQHQPAETPAQASGSAASPPPAPPPNKVYISSTFSSKKRHQLQFRFVDAKVLILFELA